MQIYLLTNRVSGKVYVGQTTRDPEERFVEHRSNAKNKRVRGRQAITLAIHKHGWESFSQEILETCSSQEELNLAETIWIERYNCMCPNGYNLTTGGGNAGKPSDETRAKMSKSMTGIPHGPMSDEQKAIRSRAGIGRIFSEDRKRRISESQIGKIRSPESIKKMIESKTGKKLPLRTAEHCRRISEAKVGGRHSEETKKKLSEASRLWWARKKESEVANVSGELLS